MFAEPRSPAGKLQTRLPLSVDDFDGVVFDLDDLLIGTQKLSLRPGLTSSLYAVAIENVSGERLHETLKQEIAEIIETVPSAGLLSSLLKKLRQLGLCYFENHTPEELGRALEPYRRTVLHEAARQGAFPLLPGAENIICSMASKNKTVALFSSNRRGINHPLLELIFTPAMRSAFRPELILYGDELAELGLERKPQPDGYLELSKRAGIVASRMIAIDDSCEGLEGALSAGFRHVIAVDGGKGTDYTAIKSPKSQNLSLLKSLEGLSLV